GPSSASRGCRSSRARPPPRPHAPRATPSPPLSLENERGAWHPDPMLAAFSAAPSGSNAANPAGSGHDAVAAAVKVVRESGLAHRTTSMFTEIEGESWDEVMDVVKRATEAVMPFGSRVSLVLKADIRPGYTGELDAKVERLEAASDAAQDGDRP